MSKHTPEPDLILNLLKKFNEVDTPSLWWNEGSRVYKDDRHYVRRIATFEWESHATRAVQCVNACAGMADPAAEIAKLKADKARLIEALKEAIPYMERFSEVWSRQDAKQYRKLLTEMEQ